MYKIMKIQHKILNISIEEIKIKLRYNSKIKKFKNIKF